MSQAGSVRIVSSNLPPSFISRWEDKNQNFTAESGVGYFVYGYFIIGITLPENPNQGDTVAFVADRQSGFMIIAVASGSGTNIVVGYNTTAVSITNTRFGNSITLVYRAVDNTWFAVSCIRNWKGNFV